MTVATFSEYRLRLIVHPAEEDRFPVERVAPDGHALGTVYLDRAHARHIASSWLEGNAEAGAELSALVWASLEDDLESIYPVPGHDWSERPIPLVDVELRAADRELAELPWEDLRWPTAGSLSENYVVVRRVFPAFPRVGEIPLSLPMRWVGLGAPLEDWVRRLFRDHSPEEYSLAIEVERWDDEQPLADAAQGYARGRPVDLLFVAGYECRRLADWPAEGLLRALDRLRVRLLLLDPLPPDLRPRAWWLSLAGEVARLGGPGIVVQRGESRAAYFGVLLDSLIHDYPVEWSSRSALLGLNFEDWYWPGADAERSPHLPPPALYLGGGRGGLLRPSTVPQPRVRRLSGATLAQIQRIDEDRWDAWFEQPQEWPRDLARLNPTRDEWPRILSRAKRGLTDFSRERRGLLPLARQVAEALAYSFPVEGAPARDLAGRVVNLAFARGASAQTARAVPADEMLLLGELVHLRLDVGPRSPESIVVNPAPFPEEAIDWEAPEVVRAGGVWIEAVVFTRDFELVGGDLLSLWLPRSDPSNRLYIPLIPRRVGQAGLRLGLYYRDNLLQSFMVEATVRPCERERPVLPKGAPANRARIEYSTVGDMGAVEDVPERAATIITNCDADGEMRIQVKAGDLRDDYSLGEGTRFVEDIREALDKIGTRRDPATGRARRYRYRRGAVNAGSPKQLEDALKELAGLGWQLYDALFGRSVRERLAVHLFPSNVDRPIHIARAVQGRVIPWTVVYDRPYAFSEPEQATVCLKALEDLQGARTCHVRSDCPLRGGDPDHVVCPWHFWGFRLAIEQPPQQVRDAQDGEAAGHARPVRRLVRAGAWMMALNTGLDLIGSHTDTMDGVAKGAGSDLISLESSADVIDQLGRVDPGLVYFYCHGQTAPRPHLTVGLDEPLYPADLGRVQKVWASAPLVFINGCHTLGFYPESLSPFVSRFVEDLGASGVIGTEVSVWEPLADEVAKGFLQRLVEGESAGEAMLAVRWDLLKKHNPLGLVYTMFCDADLRFEEDGANP